MPAANPRDLGLAYWSMAPMLHRRVCGGHPSVYLGWTGEEPNGRTKENCMTLFGEEVWDCKRVVDNHATLCQL